MSKVFRTFSKVLHKNKTTLNNYFIVLLVATLFFIFPKNTEPALAQKTFTKPAAGSFLSGINNTIDRLNSNTASTRTASSANAVSR